MLTCSLKTFYIAQDDGDASPTYTKLKPKPKSARACEECFEAAFPLIVPPPTGLEIVSPALSVRQPSTSQTPPDRPSTPHADDGPNMDHDIQPWLSIPSRQVAGKDVGEALMAMDLSHAVGALSRSPSRVALSASPSRIGLSSSPSRKSRLSTSPPKAGSPLRDTHTQVYAAHAVSGSATGSPSRRTIQLSRISPDNSDPKPPSPLPVLHAEEALNDGASQDTHEENQHEQHVPTRPIRVRPSARPRSYHDILEDFSLHERGISIPSSISSAPGTGLGSVREGEDEAEGEEGEGEDDTGIEIEIRPRDRLREGIPVGVSDDGHSQESVGTRQGLVDEVEVSKEDTTRRRKRFSMPAVALQTAPVFARARQDSEGSNAERRRSVLMHGEDRDKSKKERQGEREGSAVGLLMEVLRGKMRYSGRN